MNPSRHEAICFGEVLWDILPTGRLPGGAPLNVAYHLKKLGRNSALLTKIGLDKYGKELIEVLSGQGIDTDFFDVDYDQPTGLVHANLKDNQEVLYDIVYPSAGDFIEWKNEYSELVANSDFFIYGSLTSRSRVSRNTLIHLLEVAPTKVLDINLRPPHFSRTHIEYLLAKADILKMNLSELELITGWFSEFKTIEDRIYLLQDRFQIQTVIVTMGGDGAVVNNKGKIFQHGGFKVTVADTVGSGDSFLAGFLHQMSSGASFNTALEFASGMGAFVATKQGACPRYEIKEIHELIAFHNSKEPNNFFQTI